MPPKDAGPNLGKVEVRVSDADDYEVGATVEGQWVAFARIPGEQVRANVANAAAAAENTEEPS